LKARQINFHRRRNLQYYDVSAKSNYQFAKPFEWLLRALTGDSNLFLTEQVSLINPDLQMDMNQVNLSKNIPLKPLRLPNSKLRE
jgi:GTP-binding nuclear protein Ran